MTRGQLGRQIGRAMIALAVGGIALTAFMLISAPTMMGGGPMTGTPVWTYAFYALGGLGVVVGLVWMVRIHRADPEPERHAWRYRAKR